ncbi:MAG: hypothetical protein AAGA76_10820 [Pseudomonadota bacterium]
MTGQIKSHFYVFCSDRARNGKTLLARLFCGYLPNVGQNQFHVFDTSSPAGSISRYFPQNSEIIDFNKTSGRVRLFDTVMGNPERNHIVDLQSEHLSDFFETYRNIEFDVEARAQGIGTVVYYMLDRDDKSLQGAHDLQDQINFAECILVKNDQIEKRSSYNPDSDLAVSLNHLRTIRLPVLSDELLNILEQETFSLFDFIAGKEADIAYDIKLELWNLLDFFYGQRSPDSHGVTHYI